MPFPTKIPPTRDSENELMTRRSAVAVLSALTAGTIVWPLLEPIAAAQAQPTGRAGEGTVPRSWLTGGTRAMRGSYPDPFLADKQEPCLLYPSSLGGPCRGKTSERRDISDKIDGLPMRLALRIQDRACKPLEGALVEVWHTAPSGLYSGSDVAWMCHNGQKEARAASWFRGIQASDALGRVDFDSCYPGWYPGRTIHVHFAVRWRQRDVFTSQLYFREDLNRLILVEHPSYRQRGPADTRNASDFLFRDGSMGRHLLGDRWMPDGALLVWKTIILPV